MIDQIVPIVPVVCGGDREDNEDTYEKLRTKYFVWFNWKAPKMKEQIAIELVRLALNDLMRSILDLGQVGLSEHQFRAFRKKVMDCFANTKRELEQGRYGQSNDKAKEVVTMT